MLPPEVAAGVAAILGKRASVVEETTPAWPTGTRSVVVATEGADGRFVVQWSAGVRAVDRRAMARRVRLGREVARVAPRLPLAEVIGGDAGGETPWIVSRFVSGVSGRELLCDDAGSALVGAAVGRLARQIARVPPAGLRLSRTWGDAALLGAAGRRWLAEARPFVGAGTARWIVELVERLPGVFEDAQPVFAHGDLAPVNVLMRDGDVVALLDLERARFAHPLFDAAWWRWVVRYHHAGRGTSAVTSFLDAAGIGRDASVLERLDLLAALQCLEMLAAAPSGKPAMRREWANRISWLSPGRRP